MNWKFVIRITGTMTAVLLLFASLLLFACSEFRFEQPLLINDMGQFGPVMAMQEEIHVEISGALSRQLKAVPAPLREALKVLEELQEQDSGAIS